MLLHGFVDVSPSAFVLTMFEYFFLSLKSNEFEAILCTSYKEVPFESLVASVQSILGENVNLCHLSCSDRRRLQGVNKRLQKLFQLMLPFHKIFVPLQVYCETNRTGS